MAVTQTLKKGTRYMEGIRPGHKHKRIEQDHKSYTLPILPIFPQFLLRKLIFDQNSTRATFIPYTGVPPFLRSTSSPFNSYHPLNQDFAVAIPNKIAISLSIFRLTVTYLALPRPQWDAFNQYFCNFCSKANTYTLFSLLFRNKH